MENYGVCLFSQARSEAYSTLKLKKYSNWLDWAFRQLLFRIFSIYLDNATTASAKISNVAYVMDKKLANNNNLAR